MTSRLNFPNLHLTSSQAPYYVKISRSLGQVNTLITISITFYFILIMHITPQKLVIFGAPHTEVYTK